MKKLIAVAAIATFASASVASAQAVEPLNPTVSTGPIVFQLLAAAVAAGIIIIDETSGTD